VNDRELKERDAAGNTNNYVILWLQNKTFINVNKLS
jgi:hypothetical protein